MITYRAEFRGCCQLPNPPLVGSISVSRDATVGSETQYDHQIEQERTQEVCLVQVKQ